METYLDSVTFPIVDLQEILVPLEKCLKITVGPVSYEIVTEMRERHFDFLPVFLSDKRNAMLIGLVSHDRLRTLLNEGRELSQDDGEIIKDANIPLRTNLDYVLELLAEKPTRLVTYEGDAEGQTFCCVYGIVNKSDLDKPAVRKIIYEILAKLEIALANYIASQNAEPFKLIQSLNEDSQARILGYWEVSKRKNVDTGPLTGAMLSELLRIVAKHKTLYSELDFKSRNEFEKNTAHLADIRNQIMHPVRPLILDEQSCLRFEEALRKAIFITERIQRKLQNADKTGCLHK